MAEAGLIIGALLSLAGWISFICICVTTLRAANVLSGDEPLEGSLLSPGRSVLRWTMWTLSLLAVGAFLAFKMAPLWWVGLLAVGAAHAGALWINVAAVRRGKRDQSHVP